MSVPSLIALAAGLLLATAAPKEGAAGDDREKLRGTWSPVSLEVNGLQVELEKLQEARLVVQGDRYSFTLGDTRLELTHKVDAGKKPWALDLTIVEGPDKGKVFHAIYALEGDRLKICRHVQPDRDRPTEFATRPESGLMLIVWQRVKP